MRYSAVGSAVYVKPDICIDSPCDVTGTGASNEHRSMKGQSNLVSPCQYITTNHSKSGDG